MTKKKSKFLTFCFSFLPGAGEMYLGFMKQGVSLMGMFWGLIAAASFLNFSTLLYILPIIWFYSFFNANNLSSLSDDEFYMMEDRYLLFGELSKNDHLLLRKYRKAIACILIFFGASVLWNIFSRFLLNVVEFLLPGERLYQAIYTLTHTLPQIIVALGIIYLGYRLIHDQKNRLTDDIIS
ncbi:MAG: hypothetical protein ACLTKI_01965 [Lachnospiraceae bacterium]